MSSRRRDERRSDLVGPGAYSRTYRQHTRRLSGLDRTLRQHDLPSGSDRRHRGASPGISAQYGCGGYIGRASGRSFDARRDFAYAPYDQLEFETPVLVEGDVNAKVWIRIREIQQSLRLIHQILDGMPWDKFGPRSPALANRARASLWSRAFAATSWSGFGWARTAASSAATCATRRGFNGLCWKRRSTAISWRISNLQQILNCSYSGHDL